VLAAMTQAPCAELESTLANSWRFVAYCRRINATRDHEMSKHLSIPDDYPELLEQLKTRIRAAQVRAALSVNRELVGLYWHIGHEILARQQTAGWGAKVIDRLSADLRREFPEMKGFSPRNLKYMRAFAEAWPDGQFVQQAVAQIPWGHNVSTVVARRAARRSPSLRAVSRSHSYLGRVPGIHRTQTGNHAAPAARLAVLSLQR
jgi:predicted nuclease of restriction endonuclease-like (RecB) superfamily